MLLCWVAFGTVLAGFEDFVEAAQALAGHGASHVVDGPELGQEFPVYSSASNLATKRQGGGASEHHLPKPALEGFIVPHTSLIQKCTDACELLAEDLGPLLG